MRVDLFPALPDIDTGFYGDDCEVSIEKEEDRAVLYIRLIRTGVNSFDQFIDSIPELRGSLNQYERDGLTILEYFNGWSGLSIIPDLVFLDTFTLRTHPIRPDDTPDEHHAVLSMNFHIYFQNTPKALIIDDRVWLEDIENAT